LSIINRESTLFFVALTFLTRLPAPSWVNFDQESLKASARYFPIVGALVGAITGSTFLLFTPIFTHELSVILSIAVGVLVTGAFHEDGFADSCDGFGGGWDKQQVLRIMKDSRVGTYGVLGLGLILATKFFALLALTPESVAAILILSHSVSRLVSVSFLFNYQYVRDDAQSKVKPLAGELSLKALLFAVLSVSPLLLMLSLRQAVFLIIGLFLLRRLIGWFLVKRIGGYTGDCLGAVQQVAEVLIYLIIIAAGGDR
jgi:adenosylcobinamide-GDP ribazoletransferase